MEVLKKLPLDIQNKIFYYALPKIDKDLKDSIEIITTHNRLKYMYIQYTKSNSENYGVFLKDGLTHEEQQNILKKLQNCGCCERHSCGILRFPHCNHIVGYRSKNNMRYSSDDLNFNNCFCGCKCSCRHEMRWLLRMNPKLNIF